MRKRLQKWMPDHETVKRYRWLRPFERLLQSPYLWHLHRRSVAGGVAIGLFCGLIPGPLQMLAATASALLLRGNLPVALFTTLYTNPLTIVPLYVVAYKLGSRVSAAPQASLPGLPELHWQHGYSELWSWLADAGRPLLVGVPLLALLLALSGYVLVRLAWRAMVVWRWRARHKKQA